MQGRGLWLIRNTVTTLTAATPVCAILLLLVILVAHAPALWAGFVYDDRNDILLNPSAQAKTFPERLAVVIRPESKRLLT